MTRTDDRPGPLPLPTLLSRALGHLTSELEEAAGVGPTVPSLAVWSNVLRCVAQAGEEGLDEAALAHEARISKRLAVAGAKGAVRRGWVRASPIDGTRRRLLQLADGGRPAAEIWPARLAELDAEWAARPLRSALEELVSQLLLELPHHPASYGTADPSAVGGAFVPPSGDLDGVPAHGVDWKPVLRASGDTVSALPLTALLSQALMAFTIDYERAPAWPLASTARVCVHIGADPRPLSELPADHGITGDGKSLLERHLVAQVTTDPARPRSKLVSLTERGRAVVGHHQGNLDRVESRWRGRFGDDLVDRLRDGLGPLAAAGHDQPDHVAAPLHLG